jgi:hypothetical protein
MVKMMEMIFFMRMPPCRIGIDTTIISQKKKKWYTVPGEYLYKMPPKRKKTLRLAAVFMLRP